MTTRRTFLGQIGSGVLAVGLGPSLATELGLARALGRFDDDDEAVSLGGHEALAMMLETQPAGVLLPALAASLKSGALTTRGLIIGSALANARRCGGTDYNGYHAFMAHLPALEMSKAMPSGKEAVPVLKVVWRNARFLREAPRSALVAPLPAPENSGVREGVRSADITVAERAFAWHSGRGESERRQAVLGTVLDGVDVHRIVLAARAFDVAELAGPEHAGLLLRQIVRHCADVEARQRARGSVYTELRKQIPALATEHRFAALTLGTKDPGAEWVSRFARAVADADRTRAAADVAAALSDGVDPEVIGRGLSLAATQIILRDPGRAEEEPNKPLGSVHGASKGVHASDSMHAWRSVAKRGDAAHTAASLTVAAHYVAGRTARGLTVKFSGEPLETDVAETLRGLGQAIVGTDQGLAVQHAARASVLGEFDAALNLLRSYAVRQDGALHAEKYFRTQETAIRGDHPAHRGEHLQALARVVTSGFCCIAEQMSQIDELFSG